MALRGYVTFEVGYEADSEEANAEGVVCSGRGCMAGVPLGVKCPNICCSPPGGPPAIVEPASGVRYRICDDIEERGRCTSDIAVTT